MHTLVAVTKVTAHPAYALALAGFVLTRVLRGVAEIISSTTYNALYHADPYKPNKQGAGLSRFNEPMTGKMIYYSSPLLFP